MNRAAILVMSPGQVEVPAESRADVSVHGLWMRETTVLFDTYLCMMPEKFLKEKIRKRRTCNFRLASSVDLLLLQWSTLRTKYLERMT